MTIPSQWRGSWPDPEEGPRYVGVMRGVGRPFLMLLPPTALRKLMQRFEDFKKTNPGQMDLVRAIFAQSDFLQMDSQHRIRIKDEMLAYAGIPAKPGGEILLAGAMDKIEVWSPGAYDHQVSETVSYEEAATKVEF